MFAGNADLIAAFFTQDELFPYKRYQSGVIEGTGGIYVNKTPQNKNPLLLVKEDLINSAGYGLKRGFYEVKPDENIKMLLLLQSGQIKAKVPIVSIRRIEDTPIKKEKISETKKKKKYKKGKSPDDYIHSSANLLYDKEQEHYILIWELENTRIIGIIKL